MVLEQAFHGLAHAFVLKTTAVQAGRVITGSSSAIMPLLAVEEGQLHGQRIGHAHLHARGHVLAQALAVLVVERAGFEQQAAGHAVGARLLDQLFVQRVDGVGRTRELQVFVLAPRPACAGIRRRSAPVR